MSEGPDGGRSVAEGQVGAGFQAIAAGDWCGARDAFSAVLEVAEVPEAFFGLANALFWLGDLAGTIASCEKAYAGSPPRRRDVRRGCRAFAGGLQQGVSRQHGRRSRVAVTSSADYRERGSGVARGALGSHLVHYGRPGGERGPGAAGGRDRTGERYGCPFLYAECRTYYGRVLFENGDWSAAETFLTDAISMSRGVFVAPYAFAAGTLAELRLAQGRIEDAARVLRGVEGREEAAAAVASVHLAQGEPSAAAAVLRRRLAATSPDRLDVAAVIELLGEAEIALGDGEAAIQRAHALVSLALPTAVTPSLRTASVFSGTRLRRRMSWPRAPTWRRRSRRSPGLGFLTAPRRRGCCLPECSGAATVRWWGLRRGWHWQPLRIWEPTATRTQPPR